MVSKNMTLYGRSRRLSHSTPTALVPPSAMQFNSYRPSFKYGLFAQLHFSMAIIIERHRRRLQV